MKEMDGIRKAGWTGFILYLGLLMYFMFFADVWGRTQTTPGYSYNFIPFREIGRYLFNWKTIGAGRVFLNLVGNVVGFMPTGFFIPLLYRYHRRVQVIFACSFLFSLSIELLQLFTQVGSCDVDDVILNTLGGLLGYWFFLKWRDYRRKKRVLRGSNQQSGT